MQDHPPASDCGDARGDEAIFKCADEQFWRVFQRDFDDRKAFWRTMVALEEPLTITPRFAKAPVTSVFP